MIKVGVSRLRITAILRPFPEGFATSTVNRAETAQLPEFLRELRDLR
jgi:hypothetical protein